MTQVQEKILNRIKDLKKTYANGQSNLYIFFQSLLYGNWANQNKTQLKHYNFYTKRSTDCAVYLHERHIQLLSCVDKSMTGVRRYFNIKRLSISEIHSEYEMDQNLEKDKYLILKQKDEEIILLFSGSKQKNNFFKSLSQLKSYFYKLPDMYDPSILKAFVKADINQNDEINWEELKHLVRMMKIDLNDTMKLFIKKILKKQKIQKIYFSQFEKMWKIFYCREQLSQTFQKYNNQKFRSFDDYLQPKLDVKQFKRFLKQQQQQTEVECDRIIKQMFQNQKSEISFYNFCLYIFSEQNNILSPKYKNTPMSDQKPLNHYHCYSSHNTYLTGNQLTSSSRIQRYLIDLQNGLRCVEIDIHDGSDGPIVKHGYTFTSAVKFKDVIQTINRFSLIQKNHTPIILSLQNHCNQQNQNQMSSILRQIFRDRIVLVDQKSKSFPSLKSCLGKILIKGPGNFELFAKSVNTKLKKILEDSCSEQDEEEENQKQDQMQGGNENFDIRDSFTPIFYNKRRDFYNKIAQLKKSKQQFSQIRRLFIKGSQQPSNLLGGYKNISLEKTNSNNNLGKTHHKYKISGSLLQITSILSKAKLQNKKNCHWQSLSFNQKKILDFYANKKLQIQNLSKIKWFRSYPRGTRFDSSNYNPIHALELGVQIIALNTQKQNDVNVHILKTFFTKGISRYPGYRQRVAIEKKQSKNEHDQNQQLMKIQIDFISALRIYQNQDDSITVPSVCIEAFFQGTQRDNQLNNKILVKRPYTEVVHNNSFNPKFKKGETLQIKSRDPDLGFVIIQVQNCGRSVLSLDSLKPGWRVFSLYQNQLKQKQSRILCKIKLIKHTKAKIEN